MGKLLKFIMVIISAAVLIFIVAGVIKGIPNIQKESHQSQNLPGKAEYNKVQIGDAKTGKGGMTIAEVEKILGKPTDQTLGNSGDKELTAYTYATNAGPHSILVTFINGHAAAKTQTGL